MVNKDLGERILVHYDNYLGDFVNSSLFCSDDNAINIQLLRYDNVFEGCNTYASLGITKYSNQIHSKYEIIYSIDKDYEKSSCMIATTMIYILSKGLHITKGSYVEGVDIFDLEFCQSHNIGGVYFTECYPFPEEFSVIEKDVKMYMAFFISKDEVAIIDEKGSDEFENELEMHDIDIMELDRITLQVR